MWVPGMKLGWSGLSASAFNCSAIFTSLDTLLNSLFMCMDALGEHTSYVPWACLMPTKARRRLRDPWNWSYKWLSHHICAGDWTLFSGKAANALNDLAISLVSKYTSLYSLCIQRVERTVLPPLLLWYTVLPKFWNLGIPLYLTRTLYILIIKIKI